MHAVVTDNLSEGLGVCRSTSGIELWRWFYVRRANSDPAGSSANLLASFQYVCFFLLFLCKFGSLSV